jgi:hydrogenase expression/formation protein HypC
MCLAIPAQIERIEGDQAVVVVEGSRTTVMAALVPDAKVGDWVLVHAGMAIAVVDEQQAREAFALLKQGWANADQDAAEGS